MEENKRMLMWLKELIDRDKKTKKEDVGDHKATQVDGSLLDGSIVKANECPDNDTVNDSSKFVTHAVEKAWIMNKVVAQVQETQGKKYEVDKGNDRGKAEMEKERNDKRDRVVAAKRRKNYLKKE